MAIAWEAGLPNEPRKPGVCRCVKEFSTGLPRFSRQCVCRMPTLSGCQLFIEAARRARSFDSDELREVLLAGKTKTVLGDFSVDERGFQVGHKPITIQWQVVVWPDELASEKPRFPTPP